jgi:hypothetical protein
MGASPPLVECRRKWYSMYIAQDTPGYSIIMYLALIVAYSYPGGSEWAKERR